VRKNQEKTEGERSQDLTEFSLEIRPLVIDQDLHFPPDLASKCIGTEKNIEVELEEAKEANLGFGS